MIRQKGSSYLPGNLLTLLSTGEDAFKAMLDAIAAANATINLEAYIFNSDRTGSEFGRLLCVKARAGVRVRIIIDAIRTRDDEAAQRRLAGEVARIVERFPVPGLSPA